MLSLKGVRDDELLRQLAQLVRQSRGVEAEVVAHIAEVELRRLWARQACSSMFDYCRRILGLRENEAYLRITVARAAREHPVLLEMLGDGRLHLSGIARLAPHLTRENAEALLERACGMSHREMRELVAELEPRPDVAPAIRKLPERRMPVHSLPVHSSRVHSSRVHPAISGGSASVGVGSGGALQLGAPRVESDDVNLEPGPLARPEVVLGSTARGEMARGSGRPRGVAGGEGASGDVTGGDVTGGDQAPGDVARRAMDLPPRAAASFRRAVVEPRAPSRYQVRFAASAELREKLERLQALMRSSVPDGDLGRIIHIAVSEKLQRVEAKRFGQTKAPRSEPADAETTPPHATSPLR